MAQSIQIQVLPHEIEVDILKQKIATLMKISIHEIEQIYIDKKSIDARQKLIKINLTLKIFFKGEKIDLPIYELPNYKNVANNQEVIVIGAG
ncbi:MAG: FAD-binding protein, partial [Flavobacterium sp.]